MCNKIQIERYKMNIPTNLKFSKDHEWCAIEGNIATIGITDFAQGELGDIVYVDIDSLDQTLNAGDVFGSVEAVKTVSDLYMPITGKIVEINAELESAPESINTDAYGKGWIVKVEITDESSVEELLDAESYKSLIAG